MHQRYPLIVLFSLITVALGIWSGLGVVRPAGLPFTLEPVTGRTIRIEPLRNVPFPAGLKAGEMIELRAQSFELRSLMVGSMSGARVAPGIKASLTVNRDGRYVAVPFTTRRLGADPQLRLARYLGLAWITLLCLTALITLWRGKHWGAWGISVWAIANLVGVGLQLVSASGFLLLAMTLAAQPMYLAARVGFYMMAEATAGPALRAGARRQLRWSFIALLLAGFAYELAAPLASVLMGLILPPLLATVWALPYLLATAALLIGYRQSDSAWRQRLRWMFWSALLFTFGIQLSNVPLFGEPTSLVVQFAAWAVAMAGLLYAVLRHRVVDMTFVVNRAVVYSATLSVVVGIFILLESFVEKAALPRDASLVLELGVPLMVGFSLEAVRKRLEQLSERVFFRRRFKAEAALRAFSRHCGYIEQPERLVEQTLRELVTHIGAPAAAFYWHDADGYRLLGRRGTHDYPEELELDDRAMVALRADRDNVDLEDYESGLGSDGLLLPAILRGELLGAIVLANRPGEHYAPDEREFLGPIVHEVGAALHALHARENARLVAQLASGELGAAAAAERARALAQPA